MRQAMSIRNTPFGYVFENGAITVNEAERKVVEEIAERYLGGNSLQNIAAVLTARQVEYMHGKYNWNKSRVKRIVDDKRYVGIGGYQGILTERQYEAMQTIKAGKNTQRDSDSDVDIFTLTASVICPRCDNEMRRKHDRRREAATWWRCSECRATVNMDDGTLLNAVTELLNGAIAEPERIQVSESTYEESQEVQRMNAEISKALNARSFDRVALRQKMLDCASEKYKCLDTETARAQGLRELFREAQPLTAYDRELTDQAVSEIRLKQNGEIRLVLINGQELGGEETV